MKDYITIIEAIKKSWREKVDFIKTAHTNNDEQKIREYCTLIQGEAVEFGNMLENDGLQGSNIIKKLEVISEVCYQLVVKQIDINLFVSIMNYTLFLLDDLFWWSVPEGGYDLSIMAIVKNEKYIQEWIEYHLLVGVQHFYIYDNESTDGLKDRIQKYIDDGIVTY